MVAALASAVRFVITSEIIPETIRDEAKLATTFAVLASVLVMMSLDGAIG